MYANDSHSRNNGLFRCIFHLQRGEPLSTDRNAVQKRDVTKLDLAMNNIPCPRTLVIARNPRRRSGIDAILECTNQ